MRAPLVLTAAFTGLIVAAARSTTPAGFLPCDGSAVSRTTYAALFAEVGTAFGVGDGSTTFNVPDLRGRCPIGDGTGSSLSARARGDILGAETHQLSAAEMPAHTHGTGLNTNGQTGGGLSIRTSGTASTQTGSSGSDTPHNNMQPSVVVKFFIKT